MKTQYAVQFVGKDQIEINTAKPVYEVGPYDLLLQVEACGICFSDTKLLHAFDDHPRKSELVAGIEASELAKNPSYQPGLNATVPGHEPVVRIVEVGAKVTHYAVGQRALVQADWKHLPTASSNCAFGYNFEGALQEYVLVDERCVVSPEGEKFLIPVGEEPTAAAIGLIEPWATVEGSYAWKDRNHLKDNGRLLVVNQVGDKAQGLPELLAQHKPSQIIFVGDYWPAQIAQIDVPVEQVTTWSSLSLHSFDDVIYYGNDAQVVEELSELLGNRGVINLVLCGKKFDRNVKVDVGRIHYDFIRYCGSPDFDAQAGYAWIPPISDIRDGDRVLITGAAGPMGMMHTIRNVVSGKRILGLDGTDLSDERLAHLASVVEPLAKREQLTVRYLNTTKEKLDLEYTYLVCMVPVPALVAEAVELAGKGAILNAFAGIAVGNYVEMNLQAVVDKQVFMVGTSGSDIADMTTVVRKIEAGLYDTTISLDAVTGMAGFKEAIESVMNRTSGGKIMVFPQIHDLPLVRLADMPDKLPDIAKLLHKGLWTKQAEDKLLGK